MLNRQLLLHSLFHKTQTFIGTGLTLEKLK